MRIEKIALAALTIGFCVSAFAGPYFTITKSSSTAFPSSIDTGVTEQGDYVVTNVSGKTATVFVRDLPSGFTQVSADGAPTPTCVVASSFALVNQGSCTFDCPIHRLQ